MQTAHNKPVGANAKAPEQSRNDAPDTLSLEELLIVLRLENLKTFLEFMIYRDTSAIRDSSRRHHFEVTIGGDPRWLPLKD